MTGPNKDGITIIFLYIHKVIIRGRLRKKPVGKARES